MGTRWEEDTVKRGPADSPVRRHVALAVAGMILGLASVIVLGSPFDALRSPSGDPTARDRVEELVVDGWTLLLPRELPPGDWRMVAGTTAGTPDVLGRRLSFVEGFGGASSSARFCIVEPRGGGGALTDTGVEAVCGGPGRRVLDERRGALAIVVQVGGAADDRAWGLVELTGDLDALGWLDRTPSPT